MQCNIDRKGQIMRFVWGILCLAVAAVLGFLAWRGSIEGAWVWITIGLCVAFGLLGIYEARKKWCVVRAMGVKTPL
ncbi:MAG: hypothetical protein ACYTGQ_20395 [Planctomycetota bacterium]